MVATLFDKFKAFAKSEFGVDIINDEMKLYTFESIFGVNFLKTDEDLLSFPEGTEDFSLSYADDKVKFSFTSDKLVGNEQSVGYEYNESSRDIVLAA